MNRVFPGSIYVLVYDTVLGPLSLYVWCKSSGPEHVLNWSYLFQLHRFLFPVIISKCGSDLVVGDGSG